MYQPELPPGNTGTKFLLYIVAILGLLVLGPLTLGMLMFPGNPSIQLHDRFLSVDRTHFQVSAFSALPGIKSAGAVQTLANDRSKAMTVYLLTDSGTQTLFHIVRKGNAQDAAAMLKTTIFDRLNPAVSFTMEQGYPWHHTYKGPDGVLRLQWDTALVCGVFAPSNKNLDPAAFMSAFGIGEIEKQPGPLGRLLPRGWLEGNLAWVFPVSLIVFALVWVVVILRWGMWVARVAPPGTELPDAVGFLQEAIRGLGSLDLPLSVSEADENRFDICWDELLTYNSDKRAHARYTLRLRLHPDTATVKSVFSTHYREKRKWVWAQTINPFQYTRLKKPALAVKNGRIEATGNKIDDLEVEVRNALIAVTLSHGWIWQPTFLRA